MINYESTGQSERTDVVVHDVEFRGRTLKTLEINGEKWVAMRPIVEGMGISWQGQHAKMLSHREKFSCQDILTHDSSGRKQDMLCIPLRKYHLWLTSINPNKLPDEVRARIILFQEASAEVLYQFWTTGRADKESVFTDQLLDRVKDLVEGMVQSSAKDVALAMVRNEAHLKNVFDGAVNAVVRGATYAVQKEIRQVVSVLQKEIDDLGSFIKDRFVRTYNRDMDSRSALDEISRKIDHLSFGNRTDQEPVSTVHRRSANIRPNDTVSMHEALVSLGVEESFMHGRYSGLACSMTRRARHWFVQRNYKIYPQGPDFPVYRYERSGVDPWWNAQGKALYETFMKKHNPSKSSPRVVQITPYTPANLQAQKGNKHD